MAIDGLGRYREVLVSEFTDASARKFREDFLGEAQDPEKPIIVWIDTDGGRVDALATMVETMKSVSNKVITACIGRAGSCGAILLSFGSERYCGKYSRVMVHGFTTAHDRAPMLEQFTDATESVRLEAFWFERLAENCKIKGGPATLRKQIKDAEGKILLNAEGAKAFGLVDYVGIPKIKSDVSYSISLL